jgi:hypothetical protein
VQERVFTQLSNERERVTSNLVRQEVETLLRRSGGGGDGAAALLSHFKATCADIDPTAIYARWEIEVARVLADRDYGAALRLYKSKG